jgi:hypothetical protein
MDRYVDMSLRLLGGWTDPNSAREGIFEGIAAARYCRIEGMVKTGKGGPLIMDVARIGISRSMASQ